MNETKTAGLRRPGPKPVTKRRTNLFLDIKTTVRAAEVACDRYSVSLSAMTDALLKREIKSQKGLLRDKRAFAHR